MGYVGGSEQKSGVNVVTTPTITFQTGQVHSTSGAATQYYASGWKTFTNDMEMLPGSYKFKFSDGTSDTTYPITAGIVNNIH